MEANSWKRDSATVDGRIALKDASSTGLTADTIKDVRSRLLLHLDATGSWKRYRATGSAEEGG